MPTPSANRLMRNVMGAIMPCQSPPQNPAGRALGSLYLEFEPATDSAFAIGARNYRTACVGESHGQPPFGGTVDVNRLRSKTRRGSSWIVTSKTGICNGCPF